MNFNFSSLKKDRFFKFGIIGASAIFILFQMISLIKSPSLKNASDKTLLDFNFIPADSFNKLPSGKFKIVRLKQGQLNIESQSFKNLEGKPIVLHFWATWCNPCKQELPGFIKFFSQKDIQVFAVTSEQIDEKKLQEFFAQQNLDFPSCLMDDRGVLTALFGATSIPMTVILNAKGEEIGRFLGIVEWDDKEFQKLISQHI